MPDTQARQLAAMKFELAMSVGESLELEPMARAFMRPLLQFVRGLSCQLWWREPQGAWHRMAYPARSLGTAGQPDAVHAWRESVAQEAVPRPLHTELAGARHLHALPVGARGWLFIECLGQPVPDAVLGAIGVVLLRLANACQACEQHAQLQELLSQKEAAKRALREALSRLEDIFALSSDGFIYFDAQASVAYSNPRAAALLELPPTQLQAMDLPALHGWLATCGAAPGSAGLPGAGPAPTGVLQLSHPRPRVLAWALRHKDAVADEGAHGSAVLYLRDITHESEVERLKSEFLNTAAHELRTPIVSVFGFSELMLGRPTTEEQRREMLQIIHRQAALLVSLVDELLDLARLEQGGQRMLSPARHELALLVGTTVQGLSVPGDSRRVQVGPLPTQAPLHVDAKLFHRALLNVLPNAFKYSPQGGDITLQALPGTLPAPDGTPSAPDGGTPAWGLRITDQGMGMSPEQVARVFERFYRADQSGTVPGTGLGMSLVKEIVELHAGRVDVQSSLGQGCAVTLWWPAAAPAG